MSWKKYKYDNGITPNEDGDIIGYTLFRIINKNEVVNLTSALKSTQLITYARLMYTEQANFYIDEIKYSAKGNYLGENKFYFGTGSEFEKVQAEQLESKITRFEFIDLAGRDLVKYGKFSFSLQDDGRTLKVFHEN